MEGVVWRERSDSAPLATRGVGFALHLESGCCAKAVYHCLQVLMPGRFSVAWFGFRSKCVISTKSVEWGERLCILGTGLLHMELDGKIGLVRTF